MMYWGICNKILQCKGNLNRLQFFLLKFRVQVPPSLPYQRHWEQGWGENGKMASKSRLSQKLTFFLDMSLFRLGLSFRNKLSYLRTLFFLVYPFYWRWVGDQRSSVIFPYFWLYCNKLTKCSVVYYRMWWEARRECCWCLHTNTHQPDSTQDIHNFVKYTIS